ncbi:MAG: peptidoglycan DD-metalloendopeptidase family protein [Brevinematia bacterium]
MKDYNYLFEKRWKRLEKELKKTFNKINKRNYTTNSFGWKRNKLSLNFFSKLFQTLNGIRVLYFKNLFKTSVILSIFIMIFMGVSLVFSRPERKKNIYDTSFVGKAKINQELEKNEGGIGGPEVPCIEKKDTLKFYFYEVQKGDSIYKLAEKLGVSMDTLISLNKMVDAHNISEGKELLIPSIEGIIYTVKKDDTIEKIAANYKISVDDIKDANELEEEELYEGRILFLPRARLTEIEKQKILGYFFQKPIRGFYTSGFGIRRDPFTGEKGYHTGIDIAAGYGSPVYSSKDGIVTYTGWNGGYGKCVVIKHQFGFETLYGHLSSINVKIGQKIRAGQYIGRIGNSGRSTGPHLHFEVRRFGRPVNPLRISGLGKARGRWY